MTFDFSTLPEQYLPKNFKQYTQLTSALADLRQAYPGTTIEFHITKPGFDWAWSSAHIDALDTDPGWEVLGYTDYCRYGDLVVAGGVATLLVQKDLAHEAVVEYGHSTGSLRRVLTDDLVILRTKEDVTEVLAAEGHIPSKQALAQAPKEPTRRWLGDYHHPSADSVPVFMNSMVELRSWVGSWMVMGYDIQTHRFHLQNTTEQLSLSPDVVTHVDRTALEPNSIFTKA